MSFLSHAFSSRRQQTKILRRSSSTSIAKTRRRNPHGRSLRLEPLEDRSLLSVFTVTNPIDGLVAGPSELPGSLRQAVYDANATPGDDTITFAPSLAGDTITLTQGELDLTDATGTTTIDASNLTSNVIVSGNHSTRGFFIDPGVTATMSGLTITQGSADSGGGIYDEGTLTLTDCTISDNRAATGWGGGILSDPSGTLSLTRCTVSRNTAYWSGGGIESWQKVTVKDSTVADNTADNGNGGGMEIFGTGTIIGTTISGNSTPTTSDYGYGGGIHNGLALLPY